MRHFATSRLLAAGVTAVIALAGATVVAAPADAATTSYLVTATISTGAAPQGVAVDPSTRTAYVTNVGAGTVSVIDEASNIVTAAVGVGAGPWGVAVDPSTHVVYVANNYDNTVSVIDGATNTVTATVDVGNVPMGVAVDPSTHTAYVANYSGNTVSVIDGATNTVTAAVGVGANPFAVAVDLSTHTAYVANHSGNTVSVIDGASHTLTATVGVGVGAKPRGIAVDPSSHIVYVANDSDNTVSVIDGATNTVTATVDVGDSPWGVAVDASTHTVYVANYYDNTVSVIDGATNTVTATVGVGVGYGSVAVAVDPPTHTSYVVDTDHETVSVISAGRTPAVSGVSPTSGPREGGQSVTITGTDLLGVSAVQFGGTAATSFTVDSATQITALSPAHVAGQVDVTVTTPFGASAVSAADRYTFVVSISTNPSGAVVAGGAISDSATLVGSPSPSGTVRFHLYGPADPTCSGPPLAQRSAIWTGGAASSGDVVVTAAGTYHWIATYSGDVTYDGVSSLCGDATAVSAAGPDHLQLSPATSSIVAGGSRNYTLERVDRFGNNLGDITGDATFTIDRGAPCSGSSCSPTASGVHDVVASYGGLTATAHLRVAAGTFDHVTISPAAATIAAGAARTYRVSAVDTYGNYRGNVTSAATFTVIGGSCSDASCTATAAGTHTVSASYMGTTATASLRVVAAAFDHLTLSPATATITAGGSRTYRANAHDVYGNSLGNVTYATTLSIDAGGSCTGATCTSSVVGPHTVTASYSGDDATATLTVRASRAV